MDFAIAIETGFKRFNDYKSRSSRSEYWYWVLLYVPVAILSTVVVLNNNAPVVILIFGIVHLALVLPGIAVSVRRMHDIGRSGWWVLVVAAPVLVATQLKDTGYWTVQVRGASGLVLLATLGFWVVLAATKSDERDNRWGQMSLSN